MKTVQRQFDRLNEQQYKAVTTIEGPVLVVAGPGTGKTQVIALRVAHILQKTQARPSNILCLTFSVSGATAMRERLRHLIGADAYRVTINTIHGFCNDLITQHPIVFEKWDALEQISDVERYRAVNTIIDELLPNLQLVNPKSPYGRTRDILGRMSQLKREGMSDDKKLTQIADEFETEMASKSKEGTKAHEANMLKAVKFRELIEVFRRYQLMLERTGRYDYDDMILTALTALKQEDWLLASVQERYQYILVDECQDLSGAQFGVIDMLTLPRTPEDTPNLFLVGDDDQAIYRFQGANIQHLLSFHKRFPSAPVIALTTSYRCTQTILDAAMKLISNNAQRLTEVIPELNKTLESASKEEASTPMLLSVPSDSAEPWVIADLVEERHRQEIPTEEIAVLTQTNAELRTIYEILRARDIPVQMNGKIDLLSHPLVEQVIAILQAVHHPSDSAQLATALACHCFHCHPADLGRIFARRREAEISLIDLLLQFDQPDAQDPIALHDGASIINARNTILNLHYKLESRTLVETVEKTMKDCRLLPISDEEVDPLDFAALQEFFERIKSRCYESPSYAFKALMSDLDFYREPSYSDLRLTYDLPQLSSDGVQLMTAHQSKGLEFHTVILSNFRERHWDRRRNPPSISMPEDLLFGWNKEQKTIDEREDERRVAYVAMTRAKKELIFVCPETVTSGDRSRDSAPSAFFAEAGDLPEAEKVVSNPEQASTLLLQPLRELDAEFRSFLKSRIERFALSVTALNHFLEDPQQFIISDLLQVPQSKKPGLVYGNAVHDALRRWAIGKTQGNDVSEQQFTDAFRAYLHEREILTESERGGLIKVGEESLPRYYEQRLAQANPTISFIEHAINTRLGDIPIKGKIDRIDQLGTDSKHISVIDFKTGQPKTENQIKEGDYYRQLVFYSLLVGQALPMFEPTDFILDFVGERSAHPVERRFTVTDQDKRELTQVINDVWTKIENLDFSPL